MKFRFPIIIIDEDWRSDSASGLGIRALAKAIEDQGTEVVGGFTYFDVSMVGGDTGVSFRSIHEPATGATCTVISNTTDGAWPVARFLIERLRAAESEAMSEIPSDAVAEAEG